MSALPCLVLPCPALPCPALPCPDVFIKDYYLSLSPRLRVPVPPSCVHRDRRPDLTVSGAQSPRIVFRFQKSFLLFFCLSRGKEVTTCPPAIAHCRTAWEFGGIAVSPLAASPHARRSQEISAAGGGSPKPAGWFPGYRSPRRAVRGRSRHRIAADLMPAGSPLTRAHRIGTDSCPLAAAYPSPVESQHDMARSAVCLFCCAHRNILIIMSCLVHGDSSSCCGHGGHSSRLPPCRGGGGGR